MGSGLKKDIPDNDLVKAQLISRRIWQVVASWSCFWLLYDDQHNAKMMLWHIVAWVILSPLGMSLHGSSGHCHLKCLATSMTPSNGSQWSVYLCHINKNFRGTLKELRRNFEGNFEGTLKFFLHSF